MALINLQTNLKSLTFGDFNTEEPFILKDINNPPTNTGLERAVTQRTDDLRRFTKFLTSGNGVKWLGNQAALNVIESNIKNRDKSFAGKLLSGGWNTIKLVASTTAQIPVNGTGTHFVEGFAGKRGYLRGQQGHVISREGGLVETRGKIEETGNPSASKSVILNKYLKKDDQGNNLNKVINEVSKFQGLSPIAKKIINFVSQANDEFNKDKLIYSTNVLETKDSAGNELPIAQHTTNKNASKIQRRGMGFKEGGDTISARLPITGSFSEIIQKELDNKLVSSDDGSDLIDFNIKTVVPRGGEFDGPATEVLYFRAYLESLSDNFSGEWVGSRYVGRAEELYTYGGFNRGITFGFKIAASSAGEIRPLYNKLNKLAGSTAPTYLNSTFMRGTFNTLTIGDYVKNVPGFITSVDITWDKDYAFDIQEDGDAGVVPVILDVAVNFTPIHFNAPQYGDYFVGDPLKLSGTVQALESLNLNNAF